MRRYPLRIPLSAFTIIPTLRIKHRLRIVLGVAGAVAHAVEVWVFAYAYYFMHHAEGWGKLQGNSEGTLLDCVYFSFTTYTTVGYGDIEPIGLLRYLTGIESLTDWFSSPGPRHSYTTKCSGTGIITKFLSALSQK